MSPLWLKYTEDVRADEMAYKYSGDVYAIHPGDKPWISEMYGYAYGAAKADVWHKWDTHSMIYPQYVPSGIPRLMHYGLLFEVQGYKFDKHWHYDFDVMKCPPWDLSSPSSRKAGLFAHVPAISELTKEGLSNAEYYRDILSLEAVATMNAGFCDFHVRRCPPDQQLLDECNKAFTLYSAYRTEAAVVQLRIGCVDREETKCAEWIEGNPDECDSNRDFMEQQCAKSCNVCTGDDGVEGLAPKSRDLQANLFKIHQKLNPDVSRRSSGNEDTTAEVKAEAGSPSPGVDTPKGEIVDSTRTKNELVVRCYRMALSLQEVKACVGAAKEGKEYRRVGAARTLVTIASGGAADSGGGGAEGAGAGGGGGSALGGLALWQFGGLGTAAVVICLALSPRLRGRRGRKPGKRTE
ncbi:hypothetical protein FOA52_016037 [Chlamydomonas sp. UWO 241]|nr:hypothetical protein FOA52_016037 [Chlamydomonas sp. UWO 241]